mgnify:CR=1 FL=1
MTINDVDGAKRQLDAHAVHGDVNGDGADDLLIGAPGFKPDPDQPARGSAFLWFGEDFEGMRPVNDGTVRIDNDPIGKRTVGYCK